jgi:hypothetical protein
MRRPRKVASRSTRVPAPTPPSLATPPRSALPGSARAESSGVAPRADAGARGSGAGLLELQLHSCSPDPVMRGEVSKSQMDRAIGDLARLILCRRREVTRIA